MGHLTIMQDELWDRKGFSVFLTYPKLSGGCIANIILCSSRCTEGPSGGLIDEQAPMRRQKEAYTRAEEGFGSCALDERKMNDSGQVEP